MARRRSACVVVLVALLASFLRPLPLPAESGPSAIVVGTYEADILACPRPACAVLGRIPLHGGVVVTGVPVDGFVPVRYEASAGFVAQFYLYRPTSNAAPPQLTEGLPGCDRVALIFNIGAG